MLVRHWKWKLRISDIRLNVAKTMQPPTPISSSHPGGMEPIRNYCTLIDENFLPRFLALYESIDRFEHPFRMWVLCLSDACQAALIRLALPNIELISLADFEQDNGGLIEAKGNRAAIGYYYTCKPFLLLHIFCHWAEVDCLSYLDSDLYFFGDPETVFREIGDYSVSITPHRFSARNKDLERGGRFNAGWVTFRRDPTGLACLEHWCGQCLEWCGDYYDNGRYADQQYLDAWPAKYDRVKILDHPGINAAPWNIGNCRLTATPHGLEVNGQPLLMFHFSRLKQLTGFIYNPSWESYGVQSTAVLRRKLFSPYLEHLERIRKQTAEHVPGVLRSVRGATGNQQVSLLRRVCRNFTSRRVRQRIRIWGGAFRGDYLLVYRGRVIY